MALEHARTSHLDPHVVAVFALGWGLLRRGILRALGLLLEEHAEGRQTCCDDAHGDLDKGPNFWIDFVPW